MDYKEINKQNNKISYMLSTRDALYKDTEKQKQTDEETYHKEEAQEGWISYINFR